MNGQKAYIGKQSLISLETELRELKPRKIFFVHGKQSYAQCGAKKEFDKILENLSADRLLEFSDFSANPEYTDLLKALEICNEFQPDLIMAVGGGSAIDMAKLVRFFHSYEGSVENGRYSKKSPLIPLVAVPTTSGTGAEATHFAVVYKDKTKYSVGHDDVLPNIAVVYPPFTYRNPPYLTACSGFDALAQGIEALWNRNASEESDSYARKAIELIFPNLPLAVKSPTEEVRDKLSEGSYWAGKAINITKTTAPHAFSYPFTSYYGLPHGHAVAICFPAIAEYNIMNDNSLKRKLNFLIEWLPESGSISERFSRYLNDIGLTIQHGKFDLELLVKGINVERLSNNPVRINGEQAKKILGDVIQGMSK